MTRETAINPMVAVTKVAEKYLREAEARYQTVQLLRATAKDNIEQYGREEGLKKNQKQRFRWVTSGRDNVCPQCQDRHGLEKTMTEWMQVGIPRAGATYCKQWCNCFLVAVEQQKVLTS